MLAVTKRRISSPRGRLSVTPVILGTAERYRQDYVTCARRWSLCRPLVGGIAVIATCAQRSLFHVPVANDPIASG